MNKYICVVVLVASSLIGCNSNPPVYVNQPVQQAQQEVISGTCVNANNQVVDDYRCDPNWISQQRMLAQQRNDTALLNSLLIYHMLYTPTPYVVGAYIPRSGVVVYNTPPRGYVIQPRNTYVTNVTNRTIVNGRTTNVPTTTVRNGFGNSTSPRITNVTPSYRPNISNGPSVRTTTPYVRSSPSTNVRRR